ncbi:sigma-E processing peptidase SpoIIGA [Jeotgalibacillus salarius]|uniref:Sigma-E processing peptidase SpoIIGA n=1 Tax=Jeotgalibacillus salarius TaxID=546023 RepID=A0A4Y8LCS9_9BACL|nr:sigma-E processing peptidase SpoIIGA [Jeotgalibacillus salarius]TFE00228.1 hypothetical protein E2626_12140 [Jeotgalibacillus salarius]
MTLYIEYLLLVNICGGLLLLFAANKCLRTGIKVRSACTILLLHTAMEWIVFSYYPQVSGLLSAVSILVISKYAVKGQAVSHVALIILIVFSSGSLTTFTNNLLNIQSYYYHFIMLLLILVGHSLVTQRISQGLTYSSVQASFVCEVKLTQKNKHWTGRGYLDSGNALSTPFNGKPVMFADSSVAAHLLPEEMVYYLNGQAECPHEWKQKISFIPSKSIHKECEILISVECDSVEVLSGGNKFVFEKMPVVFSKENYYVEQSCHCLLSPLQMLHCYQK